MDRFIDSLNDLLDPAFKKFKIQYGQIYRVFGTEAEIGNQQFKIQYGQIYRGLFQALRLACLYI